MHFHVSRRAIKSVALIILMPALAVAGVFHRPLGFAFPVVIGVLSWAVSTVALVWTEEE